MSVHKRGTKWQVRYRDEAGRNRSKTFAAKKDARAFDARVRETKEGARLHEGPRLVPADEERYDRDFALMQQGYMVRCYYADDNWRSALRNRGRAAGVSVRTFVIEDPWCMAAYMPEVVDEVAAQRDEEGIERLRAYEEGRPLPPSPEREQWAVAKREALEWHRRRLGLA